MRIFLGFLIGLVIAGAIAATALKVAWGDFSDIGERDRREDVTKTVEAVDFGRLEVAGVFELDVSVGGDAYSVILSGKEADLARTTAEVRNGELVLDTSGKDENGKRKFVKRGITAKIAMPALNGIEVSGVVDGDVKGVNAEAFDADISGVGDMKLAGTCGTLDVDVSGVGELDAEALQCRVVRVDVSGVGSASVYASESADAEIAGVGNINIYGSPPEISKSQSSPIGRIHVR
jgi:hypothetical protein